MSELSVFQSLPQHLVERIISHCIGSFRLSCIHGPGNDEHEEEMYLTFSTVSRVWRTCAMRYFFKEAALNISDPDEEESGFTYEYLPSRMAATMSPEEINSSVRAVAITQCYCEKGLLFNLPDDFDKVWNNDTKFDSARVLTINVHSQRVETNGDGSSRMTPSNLSKLISLTCNAFEHIGRISFGDKCDIALSDYNNDERKKAIRSMLTTSLDGIGENRSMLWPLNISAIYTNFTLTSLRYVHGDGEYLTPLLRYQAPTLRFLEFCVRVGSPLRNLLQTEDGYVILYPNLETLDVSSGDDNHSLIAIDTKEEIARFPVLKRLKWLAREYCNNNVLFKGNADSLECIHFLSVESFESFVSNNSTLRRKSYFKRLRHMLILEHGHSSGVRTYEEHGFLESVLRIVSPATETLSLRIRRLDVKTILSIIEKHPSSIATIRHLSLMTTSVSFGDIVRVLELMPLLTEFDCMMNVVEDKNEIVSSRGYVEKRYIERFSPLNRNIRLVRFMNMNVRNANDMALAAMLLCLMCPKFTLAHLPCVPCDSYVGNIKKHLGGKSFGRYKDRIECLFLGE